MAERTENLDNISRDRAKEKIQKSLVDALSRHEKQEEEEKQFLLMKWLGKNTRAVSVGSRARLNQKQNWSPLFCLEYSRPDKQKCL